MNIFQYAYSCEMWFKNQLAENGYQVFTTFYSDLTIAEVMGKEKALKDTIKNVLTNWMSDIKYITEFCMAVNYKAWEMDAKGNAQLCEFYSKQYYKVRDAILKHYKNNKEAINYFYSTTD